MKCDIIIPVYKAPEWVKLCVYALFTNTDSKIINKVYLINDCDDPFTTNCLKNLKAKYGSKIVLKQNPENLGFIKTTNSGLRASTADYVLLLNSDCLLSPNSIQKLIDHMAKDPKIGLICPVSSNAANLTFPIPEGFNYTQIDAILEKHFLGQNFDACTVVGNCLMISRACLDKVGYLDEAYGTGYGEETDYQFKAMAKGFTAKVAIDTYVFHKSEASFGTSKEKQARLQKNRDLFFSRWGEIYNQELQKYNANDPIKYINSHLPKNTFKHPHIQTLFYIDGIVQNAGGVHNVVDIVNYLTIHGESINILYNLQYPYKENMVFTPLPASRIHDISISQIVSTVWKTAFAARKIADQKNATLISLIQGYEAYFENGAVYGRVETSYKLADHIITISNYLHRELRQVFQQDSTMIFNGINYDLIHAPTRSAKTPTLTFIMRNNLMKGDWLLLDIVRRSKSRPVKINIVAPTSQLAIPALQNQDSINIIKGPLSRTEIYQLLQNSDLYIDTSLSEGFGLTALEAMAASCVPIVSNSIGVNDYLKSHQNGILIKDVTDANAYIKAIDTLLAHPDTIKALAQNGNTSSAQYDFDHTVLKYLDYFRTISESPSQRQPLSTTEEALVDSMAKDRQNHARKIFAFDLAKKIVPKPVKSRAVSLVEKLHNYLQS